jgi:hypothetical protein
MRLREAGRFRAMKCLLKTGADPGAKGERGRTPLHEAASSGSASAMGVWSWAGADRRRMTGTAESHFTRQLRAVRLPRSKFC